MALVLARQVTVKAVRLIHLRIQHIVHRLHVQRVNGGIIQLVHASQLLTVHILLRLVLSAVLARNL